MSTCSRILHRAGRDVLEETGEAGVRVTTEESIQVSTPWAPFALYGAAWLVFAVTTVVLLGDTPPGSTVVAQAEYPGVLIAALVLAITGPFLGFVVWGTVWYQSSKRRGSSLFSSAMLRAAVVMALGVAVWWAALTYVDAVRLGRM